MTLDNLILQYVQSAHIRANRATQSIAPSQYLDMLVDASSEVVKGIEMLTRLERIIYERRRLWDEWMHDHGEEPPELQATAMRMIHWWPSLVKDDGVMHITAQDRREFLSIVAQYMTMMSGSPGLVDPAQDQEQMGMPRGSAIMDDRIY